MPQLLSRLDEQHVEAMGRWLASFAGLFPFKSLYFVSAERLALWFRLGQ
jgi:hypothetical protein